MGTHTRIDLNTHSHLHRHALGALFMFYLKMRCLAADECQPATANLQPLPPIAHRSLSSQEMEACHLPIPSEHPLEKPLAVSMVFLS